MGEPDKTTTIGENDGISEIKGHVVFTETSMQTDIVDIDVKEVQTEAVNIKTTETQIQTELLMDSKIVQTENDIQNKGM